MYEKNSVSYSYRLTTTTNRFKLASPAIVLATLLFIPVLCAAQGRDNSAQAAGNAKSIAELTAIAKDAIETQNDILVGGEVERSLAKRPAATRFREGIAKHFESLLRRKKALSEKKNDYKSHKTEVTVKNVTFNGDRATVLVTEYVKLALDPEIGGPTHTEYVQDHILEYAKDGARWRLVSDNIPPVAPLEEPITAPIMAPPTTEAPDNYFPEIGKGSDGISKETPSFMKATYTASVPLVYSSYNGTYAAAYALTYWGPYTSNYNTQYRKYSNDCTNFTSQALRYGGWPYDKDGSRTGNYTWYYGSFTSTTSYSWAGAHNFLYFFHQSRRGYFASYFQDLVRGDILQADFGPSPNGSIDHTMIVTKKDANGTIYLTYHTTNTKNRSITDLKAANPGTKWYAEKMYSSF